MRRLTAACLTLLLLVSANAFAASKPLDAAELQLALQKLTIVGSALYVAAHPDDENTAMIAWLSRDRLVRTGYLAMTRGDGGQNLIGSEKGELLGVIRTQELLAARRVDGGEQFFTRAIDFGYSKNPTETLEIWGHDRILSDVVWVIRRFQPDVIITRFPTTGEGGHGHHTASAILAVEAFKAAADPTRFPEQLKYVQPWQAKRLLWNRFSFGPTGPQNPPPKPGMLSVDLGSYNEFLGRAYTEIAAESRSMHKSQGFGSAERRGTMVNTFDLIEGEPAKSDLFEGVDTTWSRYPGGAAVGKLLQQAYASFDPHEPAKSLPVLLQAWDAMNQLAATGSWDGHPYLDVKRAELLDAIRGCAGLAIDVNAADSAIIPGGTTRATVTVVNRSDYPFILSTVASRNAEVNQAPGAKLENNVPVRTELTIKLAADAPVSQPYWLANPPSKGAFTVSDQSLIGLADNPPAVSILVTLTDPQMHALIFQVPLESHRTDPVRGEQIRRVDIVPDVVANPRAGVYVFPEAKAKRVTLSLHDFGAPGPVGVRLIVPGAWRVEPVSTAVTFAKSGEDARVSFTVTPPAGDSEGWIQAEVAMKDGRTWRLGMTNIEYPHIPAQRVFGDAAAKVVRADIRKSGARIGYIMGPGDDVPDALRQIGYDVDLLSDADLDRADFAKYDAIVTGVRAYNDRKDIVAAQPKLLQYVENGGTLVVQYNSLSPEPLLLDPPGPYKFKVTNARVTVEDAPVTILDAVSPVLNKPNRITPADFTGWVQERSVYMTDAWDPKYATPLESHDPGEPARAGGELVARYGKGVFIYTTYSWFRQLPAGVPGAYRLFANLVSAR